MKVNSALICAGLILGLASSPSLAAGDPVAGKAKAATCIACHGANGISAVDLYPNLAGQKQAYMVKQLKAFKSGERKDPTMTAMVTPLSDSDIEDLAAFYSSLTP